MKTMSNCIFRPAVPGDEELILSFIRALADYEHMSDQVVATPEILREWLFEKKTAEVIFAEAEGKAVGYALFFHNFSTFLGRAGVYLEDLFVLPEERGKGYGKALLKDHRVAGLRPAGVGVSRLEQALHRLLYQENARRPHGRVDGVPPDGGDPGRGGEA